MAEARRRRASRPDAGGRYQCGETDAQGRISRCGDELARAALYEAAHSLLIHSTKWSALRAWGMNVAERRHGARSRRGGPQAGDDPDRMWADGSEFRWGKQAAAPTAAALPEKFEFPPDEGGCRGRGDLAESPEPEGSDAPKVAGQIKTPRPPDAIMRRPCADREGKRVTYGKDLRREEQLDPDNPNQRGLLVFSVGLDWPPYASAARQASVGHLVAFVSEMANASFPPIICGDFNTSADADEIRSLTGRRETVTPGFVLFDAWEMAGNGSGHTWARTNPWTARALLPDKRIDYIFVGRPHRNGAGHVLHCLIEGVEPTEGVVPSDHYAVCAELRY